MCNACVIESVKARMMSRRGFMRGASAAGGAVAATVGAAAVGVRPATAQAGGRVVDLTHTLYRDFPTYEGAPVFAMEQAAYLAGDGYNLFELTYIEHVGTHVDAPLHFSDDGASVDELPVERLVAPLCVIDISARAADDPDTRLTPDDIRAWTSAHGPVPDGACVAMNAGWAAKVDTPAFRGFDGAAQHSPGFHEEAVHLLLEETNAGAIAVDTLSIDYGLSEDFAVHYAWLPTGRFGVEALANLDRVPASGATVVIGAPKHRGGSGGPARVLALV